jgi:hypothetical protein
MYYIHLYSQCRCYSWPNHTYHHCERVMTRPPPLYSSPSKPGTRTPSVYFQPFHLHSPHHRQPITHKTNIETPLRLTAHTQLLQLLAVSLKTTTALLSTATQVLNYNVHNRLARIIEFRWWIDDAPRKMSRLETVKVVFYGKEIDVKVRDRLDRCGREG